MNVESKSKSFRQRPISFTICHVICGVTEVVPFRDWGIRGVDPFEIVLRGAFVFVAVEIAIPINFYGVYSSLDKCGMNIHIIVQNKQIQRYKIGTPKLYLAVKKGALHLMIIFVWLFWCVHINHKLEKVILQQWKLAEELHSPDSPVW